MVKGVGRKRRTSESQSSHFECLVSCPRKLLGTFWSSLGFLLFGKYVKSAFSADSTVKLTRERVKTCKQRSSRGTKFYHFFTLTKTNKMLQKVIITIMNEVFG